MCTIVHGDNNKGGGRSTGSADMAAQLVAFPRPDERQHGAVWHLSGLSGCAYLGFVLVLETIHEVWTSHEDTTMGPGFLGMLSSSMN